MDLKTDGTIRLIVKANSKSTEIAGFDAERKAYRMNVKEKAEGNKANIAIIKFFSRKYGKRAKIVKGLTSREKVIRLE